MKKFNKIICVLAAVILLFSFGNVAEAASSATVDLGDGYKARIDRPHDTKTGKWHGHVYKGNKQIGSENVDGTKHDGKTFKDVPKKKLSKLKDSKKWKEAKSKNDKLVKQRNSQSSFSNFLKWLGNNLVILSI
ncbi:hypothetical protein PWEIH_00890 [Listeria weihenstephanensis FSL R9-0317]|uniref:hypothetical protein n=1 Tax=Listeria weihenstephanensis TaxID=1006155 RepID=UPI0003E851C0|nr:hypothetical protein [Listeria weihenstephanensis]EUJ41180.1 hypothetical protein PWEIH_00890 [Listeria weihenstephanensis FSL R9-0317]